MSRENMDRLPFLEVIGENPFAAAPKLIFADWLDEHGEDAKAERLRKGFIPLEGYDRIAVVALSMCRFAPATWDKRFARNMAERLAEEEKDRLFACVTPKEFCWVWVLCRRYRRTLRHDRAKEIAEARHNRYVELLDLSWLKPAKRIRTKKTDDRQFLFDPE